MSLKHGLLGLLNYSPMTGYELDKAFRDSLAFFWQAQTSQIYRELNSMERKGWLTSKRVIQKEKPNKRVYAITAAGKTELKIWLSSPETDIDNAMSTRSAFLMRVFFAGEIDREEALEMFRMFRKKCLELSSELGTVPGAITQHGSLIKNAEKTKYWRIAALFGEIYYRAELEWVKKSIAILEEKK